MVGDELFEFNLSLLSDAPVVFGNPVVLSVSDLVPQPEPEPEPSELQLSINRGQLSYQSLCAVCHGASGTGFIAFNAPDLTASNFNTVTALRQKIDLTMPQSDATACKDTGSSTCATDVANFVLNVFQN